MGKGAPLAACTVAVVAAKAVQEAQANASVGRIELAPPTAVTVP